MSPTDIDLEPSSRRCAEERRFPSPSSTFDPTDRGPHGRREPTVACSRARDHRGGRLLVFAAAFGLAAALRGGGGGDSSPATRPDGRPVAVVSIEALPSLTFQASEFTTAPGLNEIDFTSDGGTHSLRFADPALRDFQLGATTNQTNTGRVRLDAGRDYTVFSAMPGHLPRACYGHPRDVGVGPADRRGPSRLHRDPGGRLDRPLADPGLRLGGGRGRGHRRLRRAGGSVTARGRQARARPCTATI